MRKVYKLTSHDSKHDAYTYESYYSNLANATKSFESLKVYMIGKHNLDEDFVEVESWFFSHGGANRTEILDNRFNITLTEWSLNKDASDFQA